MQSSPFIYVLIMNVLVYNVNQKMANLHFSSPGRFIGGVLSSSLLSFYEGNENMSINFKNFRLSFNEISFHERLETVLNGWRGGSNADGYHIPGIFLCRRNGCGMRWRRSGWTGAGNCCICRMIGKDSAARDCICAIEGRIYF